MSSIAAYSAVRVIESAYPEILRDSERDLLITGIPLQRIKALFQRYEIGNITSLIDRVVGDLETAYGYTNAVILYDTDPFPCEIVLLRQDTTIEPMDEEGLFPMEDLEY